MNAMRDTQACSLANCPLGTQHCVDDKIGLGAMCEGHRGCHEKCPPGSDHIGPIPTGIGRLDPTGIYRSKIYFFHYFSFLMFLFDFTLNRN